MALTPKQFLDLGLNFPGIPFDYESWALDSYLKVLEDRIEHCSRSVSGRDTTSTARGSLYVPVRTSSASSLQAGVFSLPQQPTPR